MYEWGVLTLPDVRACISGAEEVQNISVCAEERGGESRWA